jgi:hypothetical protein
MKTYTINGRQCIDATESISLNITDNDCQLASRKDHANCVLSRACMKHTGSDVLVYVSRVYVKQIHQDVWVRYVIENTLRTQVVAFDQGGAFNPGQYVLNKPASDKRLGRSSGGQKNTDRKTPRKMPVKLTNVRPYGGKWHNIAV